MEEYLRQQKEELLREEAQGPDFYWPQLCHQRDTETNLPSQEDLEENKPEEVDLEFITSILESFSKPRLMPAQHTTRKNQSYNGKIYEGNLPEDVSLQSCAKHQATPPKFNYKSMIKITMPRETSCDPTLDEEAEDHWGASDNEDKEFGTTEAPTISNITETKRDSPFQTWCPFIPSNSRSNFLQDSPTRPYWQPYSVQQSFSPELSPKAGVPNYPYMTNWCLEISSVVYSQPKETRKWKQPYSPAYSVRTTDQWQSVPSQKWKPSKKEWRSFIDNWSEHLPESKRTSRKIVNWQNDLPDHPGQSTVKDLEANIATFSPARPVTEYQVLEYATGNKRWRCAPSQHPVSIQDLLLHDIQTRQEKNKLLGEKVEKIVLQNQLLAQQSSNFYDTPSERLKKSPIMNMVTKTVATYMFLKNMNNPRQNNEI
jgi:hypothetical protein